MDRPAPKGKLSERRDPSELPFWEWKRRSKSK
jgi:hypothetical protein